MSEPTGAGGVRATGRLSRREAKRIAAARVYIAACARTGHPVPNSVRRLADRSLPG